MNKYFKVVYLMLSLQCLVMGRLNAQTEQGYLLRCYSSSDTTISYRHFLFSLFLESDVFKTDTFTTYQIDKNRHDMSFSLQLADFFHNKPYYIYAVTRKSAFEEQNCIVGKPISLSDTINTGTLKYILSIGKDYYYTIYIDKVNLEYCKVKEFGPNVKSFKRYIRLKKMPSFLNLDVLEKEMFTAAFAKLKMPSGKNWHKKHK